MSTSCCCVSHHLRRMKALLLFVFAVALADDDGQYHPTAEEGRYFPDFSGQYIPDDSGRYLDDGTGRYANDGSGRYSGQNDAYANGGNRFGKYGSASGNLINSGSLNNLNKDAIRPSSSLVQIKRVQPKPATAAPNYVKRDSYQEGKWKIIRQLGDVDTDGYHWEYETENKIIAEESGKVHNKGTDAEAIKAKGFFQYTGPDNVVYSVTYTADENGFVPVGDHLPTPPPVPEAIAKALQHDSRNSRL